MSNYSIRLSHSETIFLNKVLDHYRLIIIKHLKGLGKGDHASIKKKVIGGVYTTKDFTITLTIREIKFLQKLLFQHFIGSLKANLIREELQYLSVYFRICELVEESPNEILFKLKGK